MIRVEDVRKAYGKLVAVDRLSFQINRGETFGLLGPNGAGKSTTISMLVGLIEPDQGDITIGAPAESNSGNPGRGSVRRRIGISPQALSLYEELTAKENLDFFGSIYGLGGKKLTERTKWCLNFSGLSDRSKDRVNTFSGGMKRRLNIAAALMHEPEILLMDEPTVGVDPQSRNHIFDSIEELKRSGITLIYTTHYMEEAQRLCDRVAIIDQGKLLALDTVEELIAKHGGSSVVSAELSSHFESSQFAHQYVTQLQHNDNNVRFESERPFEALASLAKSGVQFETMNMSRPDLESVFLALTGRSLRD